MFAFLWLISLRIPYHIPLSFPFPSCPGFPVPGILFSPSRHPLREVLLDSRGLSESGSLPRSCWAQDMRHRWGRLFPGPLSPPHAKLLKVKAGSKAIPSTATEHIFTNTWYCRTFLMLQVRWLLNDVSLWFSSHSFNYLRYWPFLWSLPCISDHSLTLFSPALSSSYRFVGTCYTLYILILLYVKSFIHI